jgi:hypothetical protein
VVVVKLQGVHTFTRCWNSPITCHCKPVDTIAYSTHAFKLWINIGKTMD